MPLYYRRRWLCQLLRLNAERKKFRKSFNRAHPLCGVWFLLAPKGDPRSLPNDCFPGSKRPWGAKSWDFWHNKASPSVCSLSQANPDRNKLYRLSFTFPTIPNFWFQMHTDEMKNDLQFLARRGALRDAPNTWEITLEIKLPFRLTKLVVLDRSTGHLYSNCYPLFLLRGWLFFLRFLCDLEPSPALKPSRRCL